MANEVQERPVETAPEAPSLRDTLAAAVEKAPVFESTPDRDTPPQRTLAPLENKGQFQPKAKPEGAEVPTQEEVDAATSPVEQEESHEEPEQHGTKAPSTESAPKSWKPAIRAAWEHIPPDARAEIHRREREITRALGESTHARKFAGTFQEAIQPFRGRYANSGLNPLQVVTNLMSADTLLATAPMPERATFMAKMIKDYGIDIRMLDQAITGADITNEPEAIIERMIQERVAPLQQFVQSSQQQREQAAQQEQQRQVKLIEDMAADKEKFPHFDIVSQDMADLIEIGQKRRLYLSPEEAYKRAVAMNPDAQAAEQGRVAQQRNQRSNAEATRSLGASLSVNGSPAGLRQKVTPDDLRGTIEAAWNAVSGR